MVQIKVSLEIVYRELVTTFISAIVFRVHLYRVICQVYVARVQIAQVKLFGRGAEIAISVHITLYHSVN